MEELIQTSKQQTNDGITMSDGLTNLSSLNSQQEKPSHYTYLKEFRVEPCPLFKQHQCTNHRPYSCFYWHFANQRRRRPLRRKDGTFNYNADMYCPKYDENTGICPDGDECLYLHRVYGDVERKYHLRYYKTALCVHPTDAKGHCTKNGAHCAFAHGPDDIRNPIFDIRELQSCGILNGESIDNRERLNFVVEDPLWQDQDYVLLNYKTEPCKKPPRLCRQGYACPYYHNGKDKRRAPTIGSADEATTVNSTNVTTGTLSDGTIVTANYRSTPCPNVKHGDEWGDSESCESGDHCTYCHTRTEQQFHPEIYKSTKCNDMMQHGYCPRGPFCAFAHTDGELHGERRSSVSTQRLSVSGGSATTFATVVANHLKQTKSLDTSNSSATDASMIANRRTSAVDEFVAPTLVLANAKKISAESSGSTKLENPELAIVSSVGGDTICAPSYSAVLKQRHTSGTSSIGSKPTTGQIVTETVPPPTENENATHYSKAPGYEREQQSPARGWPSSFGNSSGSECDRTAVDAAQMASELYLHHEIGCDIGFSSTFVSNATVAVETPPTPGSMRSNSFSPFGTSGLSTWQNQRSCRETVESVVGSIVDDINLDELALPPISEREERVESLPSSLSQYTNSPALYGSSAPVTIPGSQLNNRFLTGTISNYNTAIGSGPFVSPRSRYSQSYGGAVGTSSTDHHQMFRMSGSFGKSGFSDTVPVTNLSASGSISGSGHCLSNSILMTELQRANEELTSIRNKLAASEEQAEQARQACDAWKRQAEEQRRRAQLAEQERVKVEQEREGISSQLALLTNELKNLQLTGLWPSNTDFMPQTQLEQLHTRLRAELEKVERQMQHRATGPMCARCGRHVNGSAVPGSCPVCSPNNKPSGHYAVAT